MKKGHYCPLIKKECIEHKCEWYFQVNGTNPNTGEPAERYQCAVVLTPLLLLENANQQRSTAAAVESFRNESVVKNEVTNQLLYRFAQVANILPASD